QRHGRPPPIDVLEAAPCCPADSPNSQGRCRMRTAPASGHAVCPPRRRFSREEDPMAKTAEVGPRQPQPPFPPQPIEPPGIEADMDPRPRYHAPMYRAAGKLEGDVALITGGDSGIGRGVAV